MTDYEQVIRFKFPHTKILALNPPDHTNVPGADYNLLFNRPAESISIVANG